MDYELKYLKYKFKYQQLKVKMLEQNGGAFLKQLQNRGNNTEEGDKKKTKLEILQEKLQNNPALKRLVCELLNKENAPSPKKQLKLTKSSKRSPLGQGVLAGIQKGKQLKKTPRPANLLAGIQQGIKLKNTSESPRSHKNTSPKNNKPNFLAGIAQGKQNLKKRTPKNTPKNTPKEKTFTDELKERQQQRSNQDLSKFDKFENKEKKPKSQAGLFGKKKLKSTGIKLWGGDLMEEAKEIIKQLNEKPYLKNVIKGKCLRESTPTEEDEDPEEVRGLMNSSSSLTQNLSEGIKRRNLFKGTKRRKKTKTKKSKLSPKLGASDLLAGIQKGKKGLKHSSDSDSDSSRSNRYKSPKKMTLFDEAKIQKKRLKTRKPRKIQKENKKPESELERRMRKRREKSDMNNDSIERMKNFYGK